MKKLLFLTALFLVLAAGPLAPPVSAQEMEDEPLVIMIGLDGFRWDYLDTYPGAAPTIERLAAEGVRSRGLVPVFPSLTFPNFYSIATGLRPERHGIVNNRLYDPEREEWFMLGDSADMVDPAWWQGEPIWATAERQGLTAGTMFWVGSEAPTDGRHATYWKLYEHNMPIPARVDTVLSWLDRPESPQLLTLYFSNVDGAGHRHGPLAGEVEEAIARVDGGIARLLDGLEERGLADKAHILVVADHGMQQVPRPDARVLYLEDYVDPDGLRTVRGALGGIYARSSDPDSARTRIAEVEQALNDAHPAFQVVPRSEMPARYHVGDNPRWPDLFVLMEPGWYLRTERRGDDGHGSSVDVFGTHGYVPETRSMHGLFVARGPDMREGELVDAFDNVDIYGIVARLLGIEPAPTDGSTEIQEQIFSGPAHP